MLAPFIFISNIGVLVSIFRRGPLEILIGAPVLFRTPIAASLLLMFGLLLISKLPSRLVKHYILSALKVPAI